MKDRHNKRAMRPLRLHVNPAPFAPAAFDARVSRCLAELAPVIDRLCNRHGVEIVFAALLCECEDANLGAALRGKLDAATVAHIFERLRMTIERTGAVSPR